jgi:hypothetical protein
MLSPVAADPGHPSSAPPPHVRAPDRREPSLAAILRANQGHEIVHDLTVRSRLQ